MTMSTSPLFRSLDDLGLLGLRLEPGQGRDADREEDHPAGERLEVLAGQDGGRAEDGHLLAVHDGLEGGPHGHLGLAVADVAAEEAVHGRLALHVVLDLADRAELVLGLLELERLLELGLPVALGAEAEALERLALGVELQELVGHVLDGLLRPLLGLLPRARPQLVERREGRPDLGVFLDEVQVLDRDVELVVVAVAELHEFAARPRPRRPS